LVIRKETTKDHAEVYQLIKEAFETAEHTDGSEQDLGKATLLSQIYLLLQK
jgi:predicted N-acetyltransferase YhbS